MSDGMFQISSAPAEEFPIAGTATASSAPDVGLARAVLEHFPGAVLRVIPSGAVLGGRSNLAVIDDAAATGRPVQEVLGLGDDDPDAAMLQLWLACIDGTDRAGWDLHRDEAPARVVRSCGTAFELEYAPLASNGRIEAVLLFVKPATAAAPEPRPEAPARRPAAAPEELGTFQCEARGLLTECQAAADRLQVDPHARHAIHKIFRAIHTLKGNARTVRLDELQEAAHGAEDELEPLRDLDRPIEAGELAHIRALLEDLRTRVDESRGEESSEAPATEAGDPMQRIIVAIESCRDVVPGSHPGAELAADELERAIEGFGSRPIAALRDAAADVVSSLRRDGFVGDAAIDDFDDQLFRIGEIATELSRSPAPTLFITECATVGDELELAHGRWLAGREHEDLLVLWRAVDAARAAGASFDVPAVRRAAEQALQQLVEGGQDATPVIELRSRIDECRSLAPLAPQRRPFDALAAFHAEARRMLSQMERAYECWTARLRDREALALLYELSYMYAACARRYRFPALRAHATELHELLIGALRSDRPQRSLAARAEQWLADLDEHLRLYQSFVVEVRSSADGRLFLENAIDRIDKAPPPVVNVLEELAEEAEEIGVLTVRDTLVAGTSQAAARLERLFRDAPSFTVRPANRTQPEGTTTTSRIRTVQDAMTELDRVVESGGVALPNEVEAPLSRLRAAVRGLTRVPVLGLADRLTSLVADLGEELDKPVELRFEGDSPLVTEDRLRRIGEILLHGVRNAIDHGIEVRADRVASGKAPRGVVTIALREESGRLHMDVADDGRGIDRDGVRRRAVERGLVTEEQASQLGDSEVDELLFEPGFSTAERVSSVSGRGVGMDAIRVAAEELGGTAHLKSTPGRGTRILVDIPTDAPKVPTDAQMEPQ